MLAIKSDTRYRDTDTAIWKKSIKTVKENKSCFTYPSPFSILFPSSIFSFSLLHNFIIFPPQCFYSLLHNFYYFPSSMFFIPLLHLHLLIYSIYFSINKYIDLLATLTVLIDFFQIAVYLTLFVLNGISCQILLLAIISRVF